MDRSFEAAVKQAFHAANVDSTCAFEVVTETRAYATAPIVRCRLLGVVDPASLRLDKLIDSLRHYGELQEVCLIFAGAGASLRLEMELTVDGKPHHVVCDLRSSD